MKEQYQQSVGMVRQGHELVKEHAEQRDEAEKKLEEMKVELSRMQGQCESLRCEMDKMRHTRENEKAKDDEKIDALKSMEHQLHTKLEHIEVELKETIKRAEKSKTTNAKCEKDQSLDIKPATQQELKGENGDLSDDNGSDRKGSDDEMVAYSSADDGVSSAPAPLVDREILIPSQEPVLEPKKDAPDNSPPAKKHCVGTLSSPHLTNIDNNNHVVSTTDP
ncbi:uncharacterized protein LOC134195980 [Corticium candelabrum]|uniref:uncharacterized protein LOC134195980 n=1 Tax=Corticium candelabrum TaxID=121492 RepID=UPI002E268AD3|nr:uncharacterized protein LOC134195980 [Corticium candelabrum]